MTTYQGKNIEPDDEFVKLILDEGARVPVDLDVDNMEVPEWADQKKIKIGQQFLIQNNDSMGLAVWSGLLASVAIPSLLKVILFTKQSSTPCMAYRRYKKTGLYSQAWFSSEIKPGTNAWKSLQEVKKIHVRVSNRSDKSGPGIINQKDMAVTQFAFIGVHMLCYDKLGIHGTVEQFDAFAHLWRVLGFLLGIEDRFNLCTDSFEESLRRMDGIRKKVILPAMQETGMEFEKYTRSAYEGIWYFYPRFQFDALLYFTKRMIGVPGFHYFQSEAVGNVSNKQNLAALGWYHRLHLFSLIMIHEYFKKLEFGRRIMSLWSIVVAIFLHFFPVIAIYKCGYKKAFVELKD